MPLNEGIRKFQEIGSLDCAPSIPSRAKALKGDDNRLPSRPRRPGLPAAPPLASPAAWPPPRAGRAPAACRPAAWPSLIAGRHFVLGRSRPPAPLRRALPPPPRRPPASACWPPPPPASPSRRRSSIVEAQAPRRRAGRLQPGLPRRGGAHVSASSRAQDCAAPRSRPPPPAPAPWPEARWIAVRRSTILRRWTRPGAGDEGLRPPK